MRRNVKMSEISDGNLYTANDMVKADCRNCTGCSACCRGMGDSILLDPYDVWQLCCGLEKTFEELLDQRLELGLSDGMILPHLKLKKETESCSFLTPEGRCSIHTFRPGICRLFPLGRYYEEDGKGFRYFLQIHECRKKDRSKIKVKKWLGIPELQRYEAYILSWHRFLKKCESEMQGLEPDQQRILQLFLLRTFYQTPYPIQNVTEYERFYEAYENRMAMVTEKLSLSL